ncbi:hypothetical protein RclHR1_00110037 [Rhizophagus clarus]|uniref:Uncharacterized protein n=1 Tax=Rhizophagus clarus TaxID=94130 RepID=A0A2Z6QHW7_9GLOM|nr:hypothetical protein RclHR1_00110037 [Rhizophagus clarus]
MSYFANTPLKLRYEENARFGFSLRALISLASFIAGPPGKLYGGAKSSSLVNSRKAWPSTFCLRSIPSHRRLA